MIFLPFFRYLFFFPSSAPLALLNEFRRLWSNQKPILVGFEPAGIREPILRSWDHPKDLWMIPTT